MSDPSRRIIAARSFAFDYTPTQNLLYPTSDASKSFDLLGPIRFKSAQNVIGLNICDIHVAEDRIGMVPQRNEKLLGVLFILPLNFVRSMVERRRFLESKFR